MAKKPISPELALVSPDAAESERQLLPERPWEAAAEQSPASRVHRDLEEHEATRGFGRRDPSPQPAAARADVGPHRGRDDGTKRPRLSRRRALQAALFVSALAGILLLDISGGTDVDPGAKPAVRASVRETPISSPHLLRSAGYVVSPRGGFMTGPSGRKILAFSLPLRCGSRELVIRDIPVPGRSLRHAFTASGQKVTVRLSVRLVGPGRVAGTVSAVGARCTLRRVAFTGRVS